MKTYQILGKSPYFTNCYLITADSGDAVLIDASCDVEKVKKILDNDRCTLRAILLTHGHHDHIETLSDIRSIYDCPVYIGTEDAQLFGIENTSEYADGRAMSFGDIKLFVFSTPGHTPGGYCLICKDMLFCGDTLFAGTIGRTDLEGGDYDTLKRSLGKILTSVTDNKRVLPGHNHTSTMDIERKNNPFLQGYNVQ